MFLSEMANTNQYAVSSYAELLEDFIQIQEFEGKLFESVAVQEYRDLLTESEGKEADKAWYTRAWEAVKKFFSEVKDWIVKTFNSIANRVRTLTKMKAPKNARAMVKAAIANIDTLKRIADSTPKGGVVAAGPLAYHSNRVSPDVSVEFTGPELKELAADLTAMKTKYDAALEAVDKMIKEGDEATAKLSADTDKEAKAVQSSIVSRCKQISHAIKADGMFALSIYKGALAHAEKEDKDAAAKAAETPAA